jgi:L-glyceraldehyde 3-phosphate reductase
LDVLDEEGIGSIAFCPLAQGLLTSKYLEGDIPEGSRASKPWGFLKANNIKENDIKKANLLNNIAKERGQSLAQMALAWVLRGGRVTSALIGASKPSQIEENAAALKNLEFTAQELTQIDEILK